LGDDVLVLDLAAELLLQRFDVDGHGPSLRICRSVTNPTMIRAAYPHEIALLPQIENAADERYARVGLRRIPAMPPASIASLEQGRRDGRLWVAASPRNRVVGFALMKLLGGTAWLD